MSRPYRTVLVPAAFGLAALALAACGDGRDPAEATPVAGDEVAVVDAAFEPVALEVAAGETVTWRWETGNSHDVVGDGFDSGVLSGGSFSHTFDEPGTYDYECTLHRGMDGVVHVVTS